MDFGWFLAQATDATAGTDATPVLGIPWDQLLFGTAGLTCWLVWDNLQLRKERNLLLEEAREMARRALDALSASTKRERHD